LFQANVVQVHMAVAYTFELRFKTEKNRSSNGTNIDFGEKAININLRKCNFKLPTRKCSRARNICNVFFFTNAQ